MKKKKEEYPRTRNYIQLMRENKSFRVKLKNGELIYTAKSDLFPDFLVKIVDQTPYIYNRNLKQWREL